MYRNTIFPRSLRYLLAVAEHGSFTRAAEALYVSQPTLSQQIKQLEESLGVQLLDRSGRTVRLTDTGEVYLRHARRALGELDTGIRAINDVRDLSRGSLRLGMTPITDYITSSLLENFNTRYPGVLVSTMEMPQEDIETAVAEDRIDIGIAFTHALSNDAHSGEIEMHKLFIETLCLAVGNAHPLSGRQEPLGVQALEQESLALLNPHFALRRHIDLYCHKHGVVPRVGIETTSISVIIEIVRLGRIATVLPNTIVCTQCGLYPVPLQPELPTHTITLIRRKGAHKSAACLAFAELASDWSVGGRKTAPDWQRTCPFGIVHSSH